MQTFITRTKYEDSGYDLDDKRLFKQAIECDQLWLSIHVPSYGWKHHPASNMWVPFVAGLCKYSVGICNAIIDRDSMSLKQKKRAEIIGVNFAVRYEVAEDTPDPWWIDTLCQHHRGVLYHLKDPVFYNQWHSYPDHYVWPDINTHSYYRTD